MITGLGGSLFSPLLFKYFNIQHPVARGFAIGSISHGTGTAVAYQHYGEKEGALSSLGMVMHGILAAFLFPWIAMLMGIPLH
jgi:putative effector of murein hydrolase